MATTTEASARPGLGRKFFVRDDADRQRLIDGLEQAVIRYGWELPWMGSDPNGTRFTGRSRYSAPGGRIVEVEI